MALIEQRDRRSHNRELPAESDARYRRPKPKLRAANLDDYQQIIAVQTRNGLGSRPRENWLAFWQDNPVYRRREGKWPIGWVLENVENEIVGWLGNLPSTYYFRGVEVRGASASPWVVDKPYRSYSALLLDRFARQKEVDLLINTTAGPTADPVSRLFGLSKVPVGIWNKSAFWITDYYGFLLAILNRRAIPFARWLSYPLATALFLRDRLKIKHVTATTSRIELCSTFDTRFDEFWEELKEQRSNILLAERARETLLWHYRDTLARNRLRILIATCDTRMIAYTIFYEGDSASGLRRARLVDFQALRGFETSINELLLHAIDKCRDEGIHLLEVIGCWLERPGLPRIIACYYRSLPSWILYYKATHSELAKTLRDPKVWAPSSYDGDGGM